MNSGANSFFEAFLDLNTADAARPAAEIDSIDGDSVAEDTHLGEDDGSGAVVDGCRHESYTNSLPLHSVRLGVEDGRSASSGGGPSTSRAPYCFLSLQDVSPIESAGKRCLQLIVDHFIGEHVVEVPNSEATASSAEYNGAQSHSGQEKPNKRKPGEVQYEGDPSQAGNALHDLNTADAARPAAEIDSIDGDSVAEGTHLLEDDGCRHESYTNSLPLHSVRLGVEDDRSASSGGGPSTSRAPYCLLSLQDVSPIVPARARFLQLILDHFISEHVVECVPGTELYEGDPRLALPLMYVANMYQTLVNDANIRLSSLSGFRGKTIEVALESHGGLYRSLAKKFPQEFTDDGSREFGRRELATSVETHRRFPELVLPEEKRVRFVVVNGLEIVEKPTNMPTADAEWFKRLTGRDEVAVYARDYKFYSSRPKNRRVARANRRVASNSSPNSIPSSPTFPGTDNSSMLAAAQGFRSPQNQQTTPPSQHHMQPLSHQPQFQPVHQTRHQSINESPHAVHYSQNDQCGATPHLPQFQPVRQTHHQSINQSPHAVHYSQNDQCGATSHLPETSPTVSQHAVCSQPLTGGHVGGRLPVLPSSPAKFCDECGVPYSRETSKFCSECGVKRLRV